MKNPMFTSKSKANRLRIWYIAESYPPQYGGGASIFVHDVSHVMADLGHEVRVLCMEDNDTEDFTIRTEYNGLIRVDRLNLPYFSRIDPEGWQLGLRRWRRHQQRVFSIIDKQLEEWMPDIVHYNTTRPLGEEVFFAIEHHNVPTVALLNEAWLICPRLMLLQSPNSKPCDGPGVLRCLECMYSHYDGSRARSMIKLPWRVMKLGAYPAYRLWQRRKARKSMIGAVGYSQFMTDMHQPHIPGNVKYIPLGINLDGCPTERTSHLHSPLRFGFIAGFQPTKGIVHILDAAQSLKREGFSFEVHVWGPGQDQGQEEIASKDLQDCVVLRGMYGLDEIWDVYSQIDIAIMATLVCEPFGRVIQEAAAVGVPTIGTRIGGIAEQIRHGIDGLLYEFRNPIDLEAQMRRVLTEPDLLLHLISNLPPVKDTRVMAVAVEDFYYDVLNSTADLKTPLPIAPVVS